MRRYLDGVDPHEAAVGAERTVALRPRDALSGGSTASTTREPPASGGRLQDGARGAHQRRRAGIAPAGALRHRRGTHFRATCTRVELHHVPTGSVAVHNHTAESLERKLAEAESIARDLRRADADFAERGPVVAVPAAPVGALHMVRLPGALCRGAAGGAGEVLLGRLGGRDP